MEIESNNHIRSGVSNNSRGDGAITGVVSSNQTRGLTELPCEVLCYILSFLDESSKERLYSVSKFLRHVVLLAPEGEKVLEKVARTYFFVLNSGYHARDFEFFSHLTKELESCGKNLRSLELKKGSPNNAQALSYFFPHLKKLKVEAPLKFIEKLSKELKGLTSLRSLDYKQPERAIVQTINFPENLLKQLTTLKISSLALFEFGDYDKSDILYSPEVDCSANFSEELEFFFGENTNSALNVLKFKDVMYLTHSDIKYFLDIFPKLERLRLSETSESDLQEKDMLEAFNKSHLRVLEVASIKKTDLACEEERKKSQDEELCNLSKNLFETTRLDVLLLEGKRFQRCLKRAREEDGEEQGGLWKEPLQKKRSKM